MRKYVLTGDRKDVGGFMVYRIQAVRNFGDVKAGDQGGFVEGDHNLSHDGNCWVYPCGIVFGNARVEDDAKVGASSANGTHCTWVCDNARVLGFAEIREKSVVCDDAIVREKVVCSNASIGDYAEVYGNAEITEHAVVCEHAKVYGHARLRGNTTAKGEAELYLPREDVNAGEITERNDSRAFDKSRHSAAV